MSIRKKAIITRFHSNFVDILDLETNEKMKGVLPGKFKKQNIRPVVGDIVEYTIKIDTARIENILPRKNLLKKPTIANVDQVLLVTTMVEPEVGYMIVDRFLVQVEKENLKCVIVLNKSDITPKEKIKEFLSIYSPLYRVIVTSAKSEEGLDELKEVLKGKVTTLAGMSGVGKSSLLNAINPGLKLKVQEISEKLKRGKHTTTYVELLPFDFGGFVADTPGFANLDLEGFKPENLKNYFVEFQEYNGMCEFVDCVHITEPGCAVKEAVDNGKISEIRYQNYVEIYRDLLEKEKELKKWK